MKIGYRIGDPALIKGIDLPFLQISVWHHGEADLERVRKVAGEVRKEKKPFVIHPIGLYLSETRERERRNNLEILSEYGRIADLGLILHDETLPEGGRLQGKWEAAYGEGLAEIEKVCRISLENGTDCHSISWFWRRFASSIVFDIGHFVSAGVDSCRLIEEMREELTAKLDYIHLHRKGEYRPELDVYDHWPLEMGCPEIAILKQLIALKPEVKVILEVDSEEGVCHSIDVLRQSGVL